MGADRTVHVGAHNRRNRGYTNGEKRLGDEHMQFLWAFLVGGAICAVGQILIDLTKLTPARILTGSVVAGVILSAVGLYKPLAEFAGAGATVPIVGFGHLRPRRFGVGLLQRRQREVGGRLGDGGRGAQAVVYATPVLGPAEARLRRRRRGSCRRRPWRRRSCRYTS